MVLAVAGFFFEATPIDERYKRETHHDKKDGHGIHDTSPLRNTIGVGARLGLLTNVTHTATA